MILDVDTGVDDALALLYAAASPEVELIGATSVMGNVTVEDATANTLAVLELVGLVDVEVARGAARPLVRDHDPFPVVHGEHGLGAADLPAPTRAPSSRSAAQLLVATGPLTNVALALVEEPALPDLLGGLAIMGGAFARGGNATPAAEANIWVDPDAAHAVFRGFSGRAIATLPLCVGLDVTDRVQLSREALDAICAPAPDSPVARFLQHAVPYYIEFYERVGVTGGAAMHDPLALALAIDETLGTFETTRVETATDGQWTRGMTVADLRGVRHSPWPVGWATEENARVALDVDVDGFLQRFSERLRSLVEATS